jgi:septum formation protein
MRLILGSQSPRRKEILSYFSLPFEQIFPDFHEESIHFNGDPSAYVLEVSRGKAASLSHLHPKSLILTADTTVYRKGKIYGKPESKEQAFEFLKELSGVWHTVFSAVTVRRESEEYSEVEKTDVLFNELSDSQIHRYLEAQHSYDKAGGYAIQKSGGIIVRKIEGCFYNVVGLPINAVHTLFLRFGIDLWDYIK